MTVRAGMCSKQGSISRVYARCIQVGNVFKSGNNTLTEKVSESPPKVQNVRQARQVVAENKGSGNPVKYFIKMLLKQCAKRNIMGIFIQRR